MNDLRSALATGVDIPIPECHLILSQPKIKEISMLGQTNYFTGVQILGLYKSMFVDQTLGKNALNEVNNFQIFMTVINDKENSKKKEVLEVLSLYFPTYTITITPKSIIFMKDTETFLVDENNFEALQEVIRAVACADGKHQDQSSFNPGSAKAKEIADKLMRGRQRIAAEKGDNTADLFSRYMSILSIALHIPFYEFANYTLFQLYDSMERYVLFMAWDMDNKVRLAGGKPDKQPDDWMKNLH